MLFRVLSTLGQSFYALDRGFECQNPWFSSPFCPWLVFLSYFAEFCEIFDDLKCHHAWFTLLRCCFVFCPRLGNRFTPWIEVLSVKTHGFQALFALGLFF